GEGGGVGGSGGGKRGGGGGEKGDDAQDHAGQEQVLPEPPQVQVLPPLGPEQGPRLTLEDAVVAERLARETADDHDDERDQQQVGEQPLAARLPAGDQGRQKDAPGEEGSGDDEERQLQVPGAGQVVGQQL